jgi:thioredoxin 1
MPVYTLSSLSDLRRPNLCVIDFYASWCQPCQNFKPHFDRFSDEYPNVIFYQVNVEEEAMEGIVKQFEITAMPTFIFVKNGSIVARVMGANAHEFRAALLSNM